MLLQKCKTAHGPIQHVRRGDFAFVINFRVIKTFSVVEQIIKQLITHIRWISLSDKWL